uniref:Sema domain, transmembrane domain (TM), and cytoplasmic domain, (semaphorin) 6Ca n=1 Tax=Cyprinus carpio carpio TaxID=630221 RepID=A0A9J8DMJ7_CYPCA
MLYIAARDHVFVVNLTTAVDKIIPQQILTWRSTDVSKCAVRGRNSDECYNYIKVLVPRNDETLFACGTNALNPACRNYRLRTLEQVGQELLGQARCPFESRQSNVGVFAEPHFLHAVEYGNYVYFFFSEIAVEHTGAGKVVYSRVARVCKNDSGGSSRVLDRHWTSFLKARLNCSVPGDTFFYFDVLQSLTSVLQINQRPAVVGVFTTQTNSIPGSAVCGFYLDDIERVFNGKFKEQKNSDSMWTPVPEEHVPEPRPGSCAGEGSASSYSSSVQFPDSVLSFIKTHPLMDESVSAINSQPLITSTASRYKLTQIVVDTAAGPHKNRSVVFLGSEDGRVLKILTSTQANSSRSSRLLEDLHVFSPTQCSGERTVLGLELDKEHHALFVAFSSCIIRVPLSRCAPHTTCKRRCLHTHDPYCIWLRTGRCADVAPGFKRVENEVSVCVCVGVKQLPDAAALSGGFHVTLLAACVLVAFLLGAVVSGLLVSCYCGQRSHQSQEPEASLSLTSLATLNRLVDTRPDKNDLTSSQTYSSEPVKPHVTEDEEFVSDLPTPDPTPELPIKNLKALNSQWERSHTFNSNQTLPSRHDDDAFKCTHMTASLLAGDSGSSHTPTSHHSCLKETPETSTPRQIPLQTLPERQLLIKIDDGVSTARQHSFHSGNIYELHRPLIVGGSCLTRQHSYSEPPPLQRAAIIRRTASLKPQIPPKPTNIPPKHCPRTPNTATDL